MRPNLKLELCCVLVRPFGAAFQTLQRGSGPALTLRALREPELLAWCSDPDLELRPEQVRAALARGDVCLGALDGAKLVGYVWLAFDPAPHTGGVHVDFHPAGRYSYKKFVRPAYRGRRVAHALNALADAPVFRRDRQFTLSFVHLKNRASLRSARRSGSQPVGYAALLRCGRRLLPFSSPGARRYGFRFLSSASSRG
ncbi:MAG TPA: hypothetical protein VHG88_14960 [Burkholderiales bacterium]|nr:hypothetical protein [Burkholderiales bacterium]